MIISHTEVTAHLMQIKDHLYREMENKFGVLAPSFFTPSKIFVRFESPPTYNKANGRTFLDSRYIELYSNNISTDIVNIFFKVHPSPKNKPALLKYAEFVLLHELAHVHHLNKIGKYELKSCSKEDQENTANEMATNLFNSIYPDDGIIPAIALALQLYKSDYKKINDYVANHATKA